MHDNTTRDTFNGTPGINHEYLLRLRSRGTYIYTTLPDITRMHTLIIYRDRGIIRKLRIDETNDPHGIRDDSQITRERGSRRKEIRESRLTSRAARCYDDGTPVAPNYTFMHLPPVTSNTTL